MAPRFRVPTVATNDVLFHEPHRRILQDVVTCIRNGTTIDHVGFRRERHADRHLKPPEEMARLFPRNPEAVARTAEIAARCTFSLDELAYQYPEERTMPGLTPQQALEKLTWGGVKHRYPEMLWGGGEEIAHIVADVTRWRPPMQKPNDLNQSRIVLKQDSTLIAVIEMSLSSWLVAGIVPGVERQPLKKLAVDESALLKLLNRWREEAAKAGCRIERITIAFEAGRDGIWLARWLRARGIEAHVIHASSVAVSREHRRAKTDRLDTELLKRAFLGWLRGERDHCKMVAIPTTK